jgi:hypothetical protein
MNKAELINAVAASAEVSKKGRRGCCVRHSGSNYRRSEGR